MGKVLTYKILFEPSQKRRDRRRYLFGKRLPDKRTRQRIRILPVVLDPTVNKILFISMQFNDYAARAINFT